MQLLKNIKQILLLSVVTICMACLFSCKTTNSTAKVKEKQPASAETINKKADEYYDMAKAVTEQCPMEVDELTTLTKLEYKEELHALIYTYLFSGSVYEELDAQKWDIVRQTAADMLKEKLKANQLASHVRNDNLTLVYVYKDKNDKELFAVTLEPGGY